MRTIHFSCLGTPIPTQITSGRACVDLLGDRLVLLLGERPERRRVAADDLDARVLPRRFSAS